MHEDVHGYDGGRMSRADKLVNPKVRETSTAGRIAKGETLHGGCVGEGGV